MAPLLSYDGEDLILAFSGTTNVLTNRYLYGPATDEILADEKITTGTTSTAGTVTWSLGDNLGTIRDLVQYNATTGTTSVVNHVRYDTFGQIVGQTNSQFQPWFAYTGREWDPAAGLYLYRARWYDPRAGRFLSEDPLGFAAGDVNLNRYVGNAATLWVDPSGMEPTDPPTLVGYHTSRGTFLDLVVPVPWGFDRKVMVAARPRDGKGMVERRVAVDQTTTLIYFVVETDLINVVADFPDQVARWTAQDLDQWFKLNQRRAANAGETAAENVHAVGDLPTAGFKYATSQEMQPIAEAAVAAGPLIVMLGPQPKVIPRGLPSIDSSGKVVAGQLDEVVDGLETGGLVPSPSANPPKPATPQIPPGSTGGQGAGKRITPSLRRHYLPQGQVPPTRGYCRKSPTGDLDHVVPKSQGGDLSAKNLVPACPHCNRSKGARPAPVTPPENYVGVWPPSWWPKQMIEWWKKAYGGQ